MRHVIIALAAVLVGCEDDAECVENVGAQSIEERVEVSVADQRVSAELADEAVERERGWRKRACNKEGILLVPDQPDPLPVWGCELVESLDVVGISQGSVVFVASLEPCGPPCGGCPTVGDDIPVDAILEVPPNALDVAVGDRASWR
jgi:uncharacterized membrane protein (UPF0127 family)